MKSETPPLHSALTPSELAALLGPFDVPVGEPESVVGETFKSRWTSFAEEFTRRLTAHLRPLIRAAVRVTFNGNHTHTAENLTASIEAHDVVSVWQSDRSLDPIAVVLAVPLVASFVDRLLGGRSALNGDEAELHRPLTDVDLRLASRLKDAIHRTVTESMASQLELTELPDHSNSLLDAWLPDCSIVRLSFDLQFVQGGGLLDLLLPNEVADSLIEQLSMTDSPNAPRSQMEACPSTASPRRSVVVAQLSQTSVPIRDLQSLAVGDVLLMPSTWDQSVRVLVDGHPECNGIAGICEGHKAIRLTNTGCASPP